MRLVHSVDKIGECLAVGVHKTNKQLSPLSLETVLSTSHDHGTSDMQLEGL